MVTEKLKGTNLRKKRFCVVSIERRKWEQESEYKWEVVDLYGEVKSQKFIFKRDADSAAVRLTKQHASVVKVARDPAKKSRAKA